MNDLNKTEEYREEIQNWFASGKDFQQGYLLFVRFSHNRPMAMQFARKGESMQSKLEYELQKIMERNLIIERAVLPVGPILKGEVKAQAITESDARIVANETKTRQIGGKIDPETLPAPIRTLWDKNAEGHKLMRSVHEALKLAKTDKTRKELRKKLVDLDNQVADNWKVIDLFLETGQLPEVKKAAEPGTGMDLVKQISAARSFISRGVKSIDKKKGKKRTEALEELKARYEFLVTNKADVKNDTLAALKKIGIVHEPAGDK